MAIETVKQHQTTELKLAAEAKQQQAAAAAAAAGAGPSTDIVPVASDESKALVDADLKVKRAYRTFWVQLKEKFVHSRWYGRVDEILRQNAFIKTIESKLVKPAEIFYNTITEEFQKV